MEKVENIIMVYVTYNELMSFKNVNTNRCGYLKKEDANINGFSDKEYEKFLRRAEGIKKLIKRKGWQESSFFTICKDHDGEIYLLDGQGRRMALYLMAENKKNPSDFSSWKFLCKFHINPMTKEEMSKCVVEINTGNKNWNNDELFRSYAMQTENESIIAAFNETKRIKEKLGVGSKTAKLLTFGEKASHLRSNGYDAFSEDDFVNTKDLYTNCLEKILDGLSVKYDKEGNKVKRNIETLKKIRRDNFTTCIITCFKRIVKQGGNSDNPEKSKNDLLYFADAVVRAGSGADDYVQQFTNCYKEDYTIVAQRVKKNVKNNKTICKALYSHE